MPPLRLITHIVEQAHIATYVHPCTVKWLSVETPRHCLHCSGQVMKGKDEVFPSCSLSSVTCLQQRSKMTQAGACMHKSFPCRLAENLTETSWIVFGVAWVPFTYMYLWVRYR